MPHSFTDAHVIATVKSLAKTVFVTIGVCIALFVIFHIVTAFYISYRGTHEVNKFHAGIATDLADLKAQGDTLSQNPLIPEIIHTNSRTTLLPLIQADHNTRLRGVLSIADQHGIIIGRSASVGVYGDNVFLTLPGGRAVSQGKEVQSVEVARTGVQLYLTTGRSVTEGGAMIGAAFANLPIDDAYATQFKETYLSRGTEVLFYTKSGGIYGESVTDQKTKTLIHSYFNVGSDWIKNADSEKTVTLDTGASYLVENVIFPGLEESPGGALILIPRHDISDFVHLGIAIATFLIFIGLAYWHHRRTPKEERGWRYYVLLFCFAVVVGTVSFIAAQLQDTGALKLRKIPYILYNSTIALQPDFGIFQLGSDQRVSVVVRTGDEEINAVQFKLVFDPHTVHLTDFNTARRRVRM